MFKFFKKSKPKAHPRDLAIEIFQFASSVTDDIQNQLNSFLIDYPEYQHNKNRLRDEIQWIPYVAGVLSVFFHSNVQTTKSVINELTDIWQNGMKHDESTKNIYKEFNRRMDSYFTRFNRGITYRGLDGGGQAIMDAITEATFDCANEGIYFFTDAERDMLDMDRLMRAELEERKQWGMLEMHVRETLMKYLYPLAERLKKYDWQ